MIVRRELCVLNADMSGRVAWDVCNDVPAVIVRQCVLIARRNVSFAANGCVLVVACIMLVIWMVPKIHRIVAKLITRKKIKN